MTPKQGKFYAISKDGQYLTCAANGTVSFSPYMASNTPGQNYDNSQLWLVKEDPASGTTIYNKHYQNLFLHADDNQGALVSASSSRTDWIIGTDDSIQRKNGDGPLYINAASQPILADTPVTFHWNEEMIVNFRAKEIHVTETVGANAGTIHRYYLCFIDFPADFDPSTFGTGNRSTEQPGTITWPCSTTLPTQQATQTFALPLFTNQVHNAIEPDAIKLVFLDGVTLHANISKLRPPVIPLAESFQASNLIIQSTSFPNQQSVFFAINTLASTEPYSGIFKNSFIPATDPSNSSSIVCTLAERNDTSITNPVAAAGIMQPATSRYTQAYVKYVDAPGSSQLLSSPPSAIVYPTEFPESHRL